MLNITLFLMCISGGVPADNVQAIAYNESRQNPYALFIEDVGSFFPSSLSDAIELMDKHSSRRMDVGYMQINTNVAKVDYGITDMVELLNPCTNIRLGTDILNKFYQSRIKKNDTPEQALFFALSAYNTGRYTVGFDTGYTDKYTIINSDLTQGNRRVLSLTNVEGNYDTGETNP